MDRIKINFSELNWILAEACKAVDAQILQRYIILLYIWYVYLNTFLYERLLSFIVNKYSVYSVLRTVVKQIESVQFSI